jgi:hypothetical protein
MFPYLDEIVSTKQDAIKAREEKCLLQATIDEFENEKALFTASLQFLLIFY